MSPAFLAESKLMSEADACAFLGTDPKHIRRLICQGRLRRDPLTGSFLRAQVQQVHDDIVKTFTAPAPADEAEYRSTPILG